VNCSLLIPRRAVAGQRSLCRGARMAGKRTLRSRRGLDYHHESKSWAHDGIKRVSPSISLTVSP